MYRGIPFNVCEFDMKLEHLLAPRMSGMKTTQIRELLKLLDQPDIISFAGVFRMRLYSRMKSFRRLISVFLDRRQRKRPCNIRSMKATPR